MGYRFYIVVASGNAICRSRESEIVKVFGPYIKARRIAYNLTQAGMARALQISQPYYRDVEEGFKLPFNPVTVDYEILGRLLHINPIELKVMSARERNVIEIDLVEDARMLEILQYSESLNAQIQN